MYQFITTITGEKNTVVVINWSKSNVRKRLTNVRLDVNNWVADVRIVRRYKNGRSATHTM